MKDWKGILSVVCITSFIWLVIPRSNSAATRSMMAFGELIGNRLYFCITEPHRGQDSESTAVL